MSSGATCGSEAVPSPNLFVLSAAELCYASLSLTLLQVLKHTQGRLNRHVPLFWCTGQGYLMFLTSETVSG